MKLNARRNLATNGNPRIKDARFTIISKNRSKVRDARDQLVKLAKNTDARQKLEKIRNLKDGKLEVKKTSKGGITITTTTKGEMLLTTRKKEELNKKRQPIASGKSVKPTTKSIGSLTHMTTKGGKMSIRTKKTVTPLTSSKNISEQTRRSSNNGNPPNRSRIARSPVPLTRTIKGRMSESAKLDYELMNTRVDPVVLKRTVRQTVRERSLSPLEDQRYYRPVSRRSPEPDLYESRLRQNRQKSPLTTRRGRSLQNANRSAFERRERSRSPIDMTYGSSSLSARRPPRYDYEEPRREMDRDDELRRRRILKEDSRMYSSGRTLDDVGVGFISPLQGAKVIVSNLQSSVTQEDIIELFGDIGALKRAKVSTPGTAEVVFVNRDDALKAVETYHNRQLDGKAMKCQIIGANNIIIGDEDKSNNPRRRVKNPELRIVHQALFNLER